MGLNATEVLRVIVDMQTAEARAGTKSLAAEMKVAQAAQDSTNKSGGALSNTLNRLGVSGLNTGTLVKAGAAAGLAGIAFLAVKGVEHYAELTANARAFQRISLSSAEDASKLSFAANRLGIDTDTLASATGRLSQRIGQGKVDLEQYGIRIARNSDGNVDMAKTLENVADKMSKTDSATQRAAIGADLFGRGWQSLAPILGKSREELEGIFKLAEKKGLVFSQDDLNRGKEMSLSAKDLKSSIQAIELSLGRGLVPVITTVNSGLSLVLDTVHAVAGKTGETTFAAAGMGAALGAAALKSTSFGAGWGAALGAATFGIGALIAQTGHFGDEAQSAFTNKLLSALGTATEGTARYTAILKQLKDWHAQTASAAKDQALGEVRLSDALETVTQKTNKAGDATLKLLDARLAAEGSSISVVSSYHSWVDAVDAVSVAQGELTKAQNEATAAGSQNTELNDKAHDAAIKLRDANTHVSESYNSLERGALSYAAAQGTAAEAAYKGTDADEKHRLGLLAQRAALTELIGKYPELQGVLGDAISKLEILGKENPRPTISADTSSFETAIGRVRESLWGIGESYAEAGVGGSSGRSRVAFAAGGYVEAPRGAPVDATVHGGEFVLTADDVDRIKRAPSWGSAADAGAGAAGPMTVNLVVDGETLARVVLPNLAKAQRQGQPVPWTKAA